MDFFKNKIAIVVIALLAIGGIAGFVYYEETKDKKSKDVEASTPKFADKNNKELEVSRVKDERTRKSVSEEDRPTERVEQNRNSGRPQQPKPQASLPASPMRSYGQMKHVSQKKAPEVAKGTGKRSDWKYTAPYGRLLKCVLMNTLQSTDLKTPIIGMVAEDLKWNGEVVIPAGTEVHGRAADERSRDRLGASNQWILVMKEDRYKSRRELVVNGLVLDRSYDPTTDSFGPLDGSAGFKGEIIDKVDDKLIKLFAATFVAGMSNAFTETETNDAGTVQVVPSARNGAIGGTSAVMSEIAQQIRAEIEKEGYYTQVAGGTEFYIYIQEAVDRNAAQTGLTMKSSNYDPKYRQEQAQAADGHNTQEQPISK